MGTPANVKLGVCNVTFKTTALGYTKGGVKVSYSAETIEKTVDQEDAPVGEVVNKQSFEVKVPMAEYDLDKMKELFPGASLVTDGTKKKLVLSGASGTDLSTLAGVLLLEPVGAANDNENITLHHAVPKSNIEFAFEKDNVRVYEVTFRAMKGVNGWVTLGDTTAV